MAWTLAPAVRAIFDETNARWPRRNKASDGTLGDQAHASRTSDHNPNSRGVVMAGDITNDPANGVHCAAIAEAIKDDPRVKYIIWNRRIWNPSISRTWRTYTGSNPHDKHMHLSVTDAGANDTRPWLTATDPGGFGTMDDKEILEEFANVTKREGALLDALVDKITEQAQKHNTAARERDAKLLAALERIEAKLP